MGAGRWEVDDVICERGPLDRWINSCPGSHSQLENDFSQGKKMAGLKQGGGEMRNEERCDSDLPVKTGVVGWRVSRSRNFT